MAEDPIDRPSRVRGAAGRAKAAPSQIEWLYQNQETVNQALRDLALSVGSITDRLDGVPTAGGNEIRQRLTQLDQDNRAGVTAIADEIHSLRGRLEGLAAQLDAAVAGQSGLLQRVIAAPGRDRALDRLLDELGPSPQLRPGLSIFIACWNHAGFLPGAVESALTALDHVPHDLQGEVLVLDDASSDETAEVAARCARSDRRLRVLTPSSNLGLSRARNAMLHAATTTHAFQLDSDNLAAAAGVATLFATARRWGAAFTYGNVLRQDAEGNTLGVMSNEPLTQTWFDSNYIDTMAVLDLEQARELGGFPPDPSFEPIDDWAIVHRLARAGRLIGFVPVVTGRYRVLGSGLNRTVHDRRIGPDRVVRTFNSDGSLTAESVAAFAAHPDVGPLWATDAAAAANPELAPPPARSSSTRAVAPPRPRLLIIGPGGVDNLGDDAIVASAVAQVRRLAPDHDLDLVTDGPAVGRLDPAVVWLGTLSEAVWGLTDEQLPEADEPPIAAARARIPAAPWPRSTVHPVDYEGAVFLGGGSLTSLWGDTLIAPRAVFAAALRRAEVPYLVSGQGIGPLDDVDRALVSGIIEGAVACGVRDRASGTEVSTTVAPAFVGDDALLLRSATGRAVDAALEAAGLDGPYVACTVRDADYVGASADHLEAWAAAVDAVALRSGAVVLGVALNDQAPAPEVTTLARLARGGGARTTPWRIITCDGDPGLLAGLMARSTAVAAHSYHAALFGLRAGVPTVLAAANPYYVAKATGLADLAGIEPDDVVVRSSDGEPELGSRFARIADQLAQGAGLAGATNRVEQWWDEAMGALLAPAVL